MDLNTIRQVVLNQLNNTSGLYSLKLQNHIYGCFILMEDIAQKQVDVSGTSLITPKYSFDFDKQFNEIGLRYGFAMESKLSLDTFLPEYKQTWLKYFKDINLIQDINEVDKIEDCLIEIIQKNIKPEESFFLSALETGILPQEWIEKIFLLLNPVIVSPPVTPAPPSSPNNSPNESDNEDNNEKIQKNKLIKARSEKPINRSRRLAKTHYSHNKNIINFKKPLAKTRKHILK
jgi:hypothetical protein